MPFPDITRVSKRGGRMSGTGLPLWASSALGFVEDGLGGSEPWEGSSFGVGE